MGKQTQITVHDLRLVRELYHDLDGDHYGRNLAQVTGMSLTATYTALRKLERLGWIAGRDEDIDPQIEGRQPRRLYHLTKNGIEQYHDIVRSITPTTGGLPA